MLATVIDIETTGFLELDSNNILKDGHDILELGYMRIDSEKLNIISSGVLFFYQDHFDVESDAQKVHGLTREMLEPYKDKFIMNLFAMNALIHGGLIIGKNNIKFDMPFISTFLYKYLGPNRFYRNIVDFASSSISISEPEAEQLDMQVEFSKYWSQAMYDKTGDQIYKRKKGTLGQYIEFLNGKDECDAIYNSIKKEGMREATAHDALYDVVMTYYVYKYYKLNNIG